jgi:hypothetical protein
MLRRDLAPGRSVGQMFFTSCGKVRSVVRLGRRGLGRRGRGGRGRGLRGSRGGGQGGWRVQWKLLCRWLGYIPCGGGRSAATYVARQPAMRARSAAATAPDYFTCRRAGEATPPGLTAQVVIRVLFKGVLSDHVDALGGSDGGALVVLHDMQAGLARQPMRGSRQLRACFLHA